MAVVQISRIQHRRGRKNQGTGLPQLASGEIGWAIDTQELYIGNGSVSEGAPQVGNTKIITQHDDLFELANSYIYREGSGSITTGATAGSPIRRTLQARLDDTVSVKAFGVTGDIAQDCTVELQRAIDQLYLNDGDVVPVNKRVILHLEAGYYTISDTIYIPPFATLKGEGSGKTIIRQISNNKAVFQTINETIIPGNRTNPDSFDASSTYNNQARDIEITGMTLDSVGDSRGLVLQSCRDSHFNDITITGTWTLGQTIPASTTTTYSTGLLLNSKTGGVETARNEFTNFHISGFAYGIASNWDINDNVWTTSNFGVLGQAIAFGKGMLIIEDPSPEITMNLDSPLSEAIAASLQEGEVITQNSTGATGIFKSISVDRRTVVVTLTSGEFAIGVTGTLIGSITGPLADGDGISRWVIGITERVDPGAGQATGPVNNIWTDCVFSDIERQAIYIEQGINNVSRNNKFLNCSNDGDSDANPVYPVIKFSKLGNVSSGDYFSRTKALSYDGRNITSVPYIPEVEGPVNYEWGFEHQISLTQSPDESQIAFRLPQPENVNQGFEIDYLLYANGETSTRSGHMAIVSNTKIDNNAGTPKVEVSDEYHYTGDEDYLDKIKFDATLRDIDADGIFETIVVRYISDVPGVTNFKFKVQTKQTVTR